MGASIGALLGLTIGGAASQLYNWRIAFIVAGAGSLLVALLKWMLVKELGRRSTAARSPSEKFFGRTHSRGWEIALKIIRNEEFGRRDYVVHS